jgi:hypothetical protein
MFPVAKASVIYQDQAKLDPKVREKETECSRVGTLFNAFNGF